MARERLPNGTIVGRYEIIKPLSEGGSCLVYFVKNKEGKYFVLKEYYPKRWNRTKKEFETDFIREGLILKSKKETRIEKLNAVFDSEIKFLNEISFAEYNGKINNELGAFRAYKVTDLVECFAGTLAQYMIIETASGEVLAEHFGEKEETVSYIKSVSELMIKTLYHLRQIHSKGILHLDLTPGNVYVCRIHEAEYLPIIIDFGSALNATKDENGLLIAESTCDVHTKSEGFSAPEITLALNAPETTVITAQADIYSIGAIIYKLLTDESFSTEKIYEWNIDGFVNLESYLFDKISEKFKDILPGVKIKLVNVLTKCLEKGVSERYRNCDELIAELKSLVEIIDSKGFHPEVIFNKASACASEFKDKIEQEILADVSFEKENEEQKIFKNINGNSALTDAYKAFCYEKENRNAIVVSEGGAGKTYACRNSVCQFLREYIETNGESPIPLYIPAFKVETNIKAYINTNFIGSTDEQIEKGLSELFGKHSNTKLIIFIDGLNEISDNEQKEKIIDEIKGLIEEYPQISFIVTTRNEYDEGRIAKTETFSLLKLSEETVEKYVGHNVKDEIKEIIRNPLLLTVYVKTGSDIYKYADKQGYSILTAPGKETVTTVGELLWNFNQSHIVKLGGEYDRDSTSVSEAEDVLKIQYALEVILPAVAYLMVTNGKYSLSFKELKKYIETGTTQLQSFDGLDEFEEIAIPAKWMLKSLSNFGLIIYDKKEHSYKNIRIYHETILNFYCALHLRNLLANDSDAAYEAFSSFAFSDEILRILGEICGNQYFEFENKNRNAETAGFEPIKIFSFDEKEYMAQKDSLIGSLIEKCRNRFDNLGAECVRNLITAVDLSAREVCGWDLSCLDFRKSYLERTKLSSYDSYSIFDSSNFSRETFEGITREEFEKQNWAYNEETDTFIGETLQINAKTGWVSPNTSFDSLTASQKKNKPITGEEVENQNWVYDKELKRYFGESLQREESGYVSRKKFEESPIKCDLVEDDFYNTIFRIMDVTTGEKEYLYFSKFGGDFHFKKARKFAAVKDLINKCIKKHRHFKIVRHLRKEKETVNERFVQEIERYIEKDIYDRAKAKAKEISPIYSLDWKRFGDFLFVGVTQIYKEQKKEYYVSVDLRNKRVSDFKIFSKEKISFTSNIIFQSEICDEKPILFKNCYSLRSINGYPIAIFTHREGPLIEKKQEKIKGYFCFIFFENNIIVTRPFEQKLGEFKNSEVFNLPEIESILFYLWNCNNRKLVVYEYLSQSTIDVSVDMSEISGSPKRAKINGKYLYLETSNKNADEVHVFEIRYPHQISSIGKLTVEKGTKLLTFASKIALVNCSEIQIYNPELSYRLSQTVIENVERFHVPYSRTFVVEDDSLIINWGHRFAVCNINNNTPHTEARDKNDYLIFSTQNFFDDSIIGYIKEKDAVVILNKDSFEDVVRIIEKTNSSKNIVFRFETTNLNFQYIYNKEYEYILLPKNKIIVNQRKTHNHYMDIQIKNDEVKIACDQKYLYIWDNQNENICVFTADYKKQIKEIDLSVIDCTKTRNGNENTEYKELITDFKQAKFEICDEKICISNFQHNKYFLQAITCSVFETEGTKPKLGENPIFIRNHSWHFETEQSSFEVLISEDNTISVIDMKNSDEKRLEYPQNESVSFHSQNILLLETKTTGKFHLFNLDPLAEVKDKYIYINPVDVFGCTFKDTAGIPEETKNRMEQYGAIF